MDKQQIMLQEIGLPGTEIISGILQEEYLSELSSVSNRVKQFDKMRKSDATVQMVLKAVKLPVKSCRWLIKPASSSPEDQLIAKFIEDNLFNSMSITWEDVLNEVLLMLDFGFAVLEKCWELDKNGRVRYKKLAPRAAKTITRWLLDENGGLAGIEQQAYSNDGNFTTKKIPIQKLIVFSYNKEGSNFEGESLLRPIYKNWKIKEMLYKLLAIGAERMAIGVPVVKLDRTAQHLDESFQNAKTIVENYRAHEKAGVVLPPGTDLQVIKGELNIEMLQNAIFTQKQDMAQGILASFLLLSESNSGSRALSEDQSRFFLMALKSLADYICQTFNKYAVKPLVNLNFKTNNYPALAYTDLGFYDRQSIANQLKILTEAKLLNPQQDQNLQAFIRKLFELPD